CDVATTVKRASCTANQRAHANEPSSEPSSTSTHCQRCSVCRCRLRRQAGNVAAAFQTGNRNEIRGGTVVSREHAATHDGIVTISLALPLGFGQAWAPPGHSVL